MASPALVPVAQAALTDELIEEIFLRLPTAADLARASTACTTFRRVVADHSFLRRFRALHPPPLLGIATIPFMPAEPPHPSAAAARAFADAADASADFLCSFLPFPDRWVERDFRDGRALLSAVPEGSGFRPNDCSPRALYRELAVCDPVHRRYLLLPAIPEDLVALVNEPEILEFDPLLAPAAEDERGSSFRVICLTTCKNKLVVFMFQLSRGSWSAVAFDGWNNLATGASSLGSGFNSAISDKYYAHGCFCWVIHRRNKLLVFNTHSMELSGFDLPPGPKTSGLPQRAIVEAGQGKLGMFTCYSVDGPDRYCLWNTILQTDVQGANQWHLDSIIPLPLNYRHNILGVAGGYILLHGYAIYPEANYDRFSLNLKTLQVEHFCKTDDAAIICPRSGGLYAGFPTSLSPPSI